MHEADLHIACGTAVAARIVWDAVRLEVEGTGGPDGVQALGEVDGDAIRLRLRSSHASNLRAAVTGATRLCDAALKVVATGKP